MLIRGESEIWDDSLCRHLESFQPDWILLAGFLKKIGPKVLKKFPGRIINSHPSLLPDFSGKGMYGIKVHEAVIQNHKPETGVSIHVVDKNYDGGCILFQKKIPVIESETAKELETRVKNIEKEVYLDVVLKILSGEISTSDDALF